MCIIIVNTAGMLPKKTIFESWKNNPDGAGLMCAQSGKIIIKKELLKKSVFWNTYKELRASFEGTIVLHFRIGTSGKADYVNCHPFLVNNGLAFCHNGIIQHTTDYKSEYSDTVLFNEYILKRLPGGFLDNPSLRELISKYAAGSKLTFLRSDGSHTTVNEHLGHWDISRENWYSNYTYLPPVTKYSYAPAKAGHKAGYKLYDSCEYCGAVLYGEKALSMGICSECLNILGQDADYVKEVF